MQTETTQKPKAVRVAVKCMECGKRWSTSNPMPQCSRCNSVDIEPAE